MASRYEGCTHIIGDVFINDETATDLRQLSCLEVIDGGLMVLNAAMLRDLDGLESLQYVAGDLRLARKAPLYGNVPALVSVTALSSLKAIGGSLAFRAPALSSLYGLHNVRAIGQSLEIDDSNSELDFSGFSSLEIIGADLRFARNYSLSSLQGFDALETVGGSFQIDGDSASLQSFDGAFPNVGCIGGRIYLSGQHQLLEQLDLLPKLRIVGSHVLVNGNTTVRSITMLRGVEQVHGTIEVKNNTILEELDLSALQKVSGGMKVTNNPKLEECPLIELASTIGAFDTSRIEDNARILVPDCASTATTP